MANSVDPDEMAHYKQSHQDLHCLHRYLFWSTRLKGLKHMILTFYRKQDEICHLYFIVSGEISVYLTKIKVVSITSELISYHFTSDLYGLYFHSSL